MMSKESRDNLTPEGLSRNSCLDTHTFIKLMCHVLFKYTHTVTGITKLWLNSTVNHHHQQHLDTPTHTLKLL